jgi:hypothetical protein
MRCCAYAGGRTPNVEFPSGRAPSTVVTVPTSVGRGPRAERPLECIMTRPSVLITRLVGATAAAGTLLVALSGRALALRPDPGGAPVPGSHLPDAEIAGSSSAAMWITVAIVVLVVALCAVLAVRLRLRPPVRGSQPTATS